MREHKVDILIVGGGVGGCAAALSCRRMGVRFLMIEPTDWIGGQLTSQAVPPDENRWIESFGANRSYADLRESVRRYYRRVRTGLTPAAIDDPLLNPGRGWVSRLCAEPRIWHDILRGTLGLDAATGRAAGEDPATPDRSEALWLNTEPVAAECDEDRVRRMVVRSLTTGEQTAIEARFILDATETGDVLELGRLEHAIGAEHRDVHGELHGRDDFDLAQRRCDERDQQACTWCFAVEHRPGEDHVIPRPETYDHWRGYKPLMQPAWCGPLFSWTVPSHQPPGCRTLPLVPWPDEPALGEWELWRYRRIVDRSLYLPEKQADHPDVSLFNVVQIDSWTKPLLGVSAAERRAALAEAREQSLCFLHWMQTEAPRHDGRGQGYAGLRLRGDELGTTDGFAKAVYIREPRRLLARTIVTEAHVGTQQRREAGHDKSDPNWSRVPDDLGTAEPFADSVGIGHYMIDLHPSCAGRNNVYVPAAPFRIPLGALIPVRVRNVLAAGKCLGVSHVANGAYRMHPVEWSVGEAAGALAAWCVANQAEPQQIHGDAARLRAFRDSLAEAGVRLAWPWET